MRRDSATVFLIEAQAIEFETLLPQLKTIYRAVTEGSGDRSASNAKILA
jgi:hypothetical protein